MGFNMNSEDGKKFHAASIRHEREARFQARTKKERKVTGTKVDAIRHKAAGGRKVVSTLLGLKSSKAPISHKESRKSIEKAIRRKMEPKIDRTRGE